MAYGRRAVTLAAVGFLAGLGVLFAGVIVARTWVGVIGFVMMLAAAYVFVTAGRPKLGGPQGVVGGRPKGSAGKARGSVIQRMEERWQRRQRGDGF